MKRIDRIAGGIAAALLTAGMAQADENVMVVFDGSNSMWGQIDGTAKIEIARGVMENLLGGWAEDREVGLMAYGHRRRGDCTDIETLVDPGMAKRTEILERINAITPTGKTPLTDAVEQAANELAYTDRPATVVLISDGLESCDRDPCALAEALERGGVAFTAHVVGFGLGAGEDTASLSCIAERTGGQYIQAGNAEELGTALSAVATAVAEPEPEPEPAPEPEAPQVTVSGPGTATGGSDIGVSWAPTVDEGDYITVVPTGSDEGEFGPYVRIGKAETVSLPVPGGEGMYEVRYVHNASKETLGSDPLEITPPEVALTAPESVRTGAAFGVAWDPTINKRDYVTIVPAGAEEGEFGGYRAVSKYSETTLDAPADPGLYEVRYVLNIDKRTVASRRIEVTEPQVVLQVPETALTGAAFPVGWTGTVNERDYITIVPAGTEAGQYGNYFVVRDDAEGDLTAPSETGMYEVRYVLREGNRTLASERIEITEPEVTVSGPSTAATGSKIKVSWTGTVSVKDYVTIVPAGTEEGKYGNYIVVRDKASADLNMPAETGMYELRYVLREGNRTLATAMVEITEPEVTVSVPDEALTGQAFRVEWTGTVHRNDYVTIVPVGTEEGKFGNYIVVRDKSSNTLKAPAETGMYEVRYVLREGGRTLASAIIEIAEPEVTVSAPDQIRASNRLKIAWSGTVDKSDYVTLVPLGTPDGEFGEYFVVRDRQEGELIAPEQTGMYELRYVLREGNKVLARQTVEVLAADAALESGASLSAPDTAAPGSTIEVGWSVDSDSTDQRITLARGNQAIFTWLEAVRINGESPVRITLPDESGVYELRFLDVANQAVLARKVIKVE